MSKANTAIRGNNAAVDQSTNTQTNKQTAAHCHPSHLKLLCLLKSGHYHYYYLMGGVILIGLDGLLDPVGEPGDSRVDSGLHGVGTSQTPRGHTLQDKPVLGITHQGTAAVALQGAIKKEHTHEEEYVDIIKTYTTRLTPLCNASYCTWNKNTKKKLFYSQKPFSYITHNATEHQENS